MICANCKERIYHARNKNSKQYCIHCYMKLFDPENAKKCTTCNKLFDPKGFYARSFVGDNCFMCSYWLKAIDEVAKDENTFVASGRLYTINPYEGGPARLRGFAGRLLIFMMNNSTILKSKNAWNGSVIPERFRPQLPDTAVLVKTYDASCIVCNKTSGRLRPLLPGHYYCEEHYEEHKI